MNVIESAKLLGYISAAMPNVQKIDLAPTAKLWARVMYDIPFELAERAVLKILREKVIPTVPLPGEVIEAVKSIYSTENNTAPLDYEAWQEVKTKLDFYKPNIRWSHPAIEKTIKIIGSRNICGSTYDISDKFMRVYNAVVKREHEEYENAVTLQIIQNKKHNPVISLYKKEQKKLR